MTKINNRQKAVLGLVMVAMCVLLLPKQRIVLQADDIHCVLPSTHFALKWRHSVEKRLWQEFYQLHGDGFLLTHTYFQSFGAGVPTSGNIIAAPAGYIGMEINTTLTQINWTVSRNMQGDILLGEQVLPIHQLVPDYTNVHLKPQRKSQAWWFFQKACL